MAERSIYEISAYPKDMVCESIQIELTPDRTTFGLRMFDRQFVLDHCSFRVERRDPLAGDLNGNLARVDDGDEFASNTDVSSTVDLESASIARTRTSFVLKDGTETNKPVKFDAGDVLIFELDGFPEAGSEFGGTTIGTVLFTIRGTYLLG